MKKRSVASLIAVAAVATSIGTSATAYKGAVKKSKNNVLLSNSTTESNKYAVVINGDNSLVLKSDPNNNKISSYLSVGEMLTIEAKVGDYYKVVVQETGATGYINIKNAEIIESGVNSPLESLKEKGSIINVTTDVRIREKATMNSKVLSTLHNGASLQIIGKQGEWYEVDSNGIKGFVYFEYIETNINSNSNNNSNSSSNNLNNKVKHSIKNNKKLLSVNENSLEAENYLGNYSVASILGPSYSEGRENATIGHSFTMNKNLFSMENIPGSMNYNIVNPSYEIKKQSATDFEKNYGYNPAEIGLKGNTLTELVVAGNNSAKNNPYGLNSFGSNNEMIFYVENGNLILFEPTSNMAYICENTNTYNKEILSFNEKVNEGNNKEFPINVDNYKESNNFSEAETNLYNRIFDIVKAKIWTTPTDNQRTMTMDMGNTYKKDGNSYYSVYLYSINSSEKTNIEHYYIGTNGKILSGNSFEENNNVNLTYNERKNIISKIAMEYMSQSTGNSMYTFNYNLNKSIVRNGVRYYQVNVWSNNPIYPGGQSIEEGDVIYVSPYGNVINTYNRIIGKSSNNLEQNSLQNKGIGKRVKKG
ncbi:SH3 domain-containing protein [Clostridium massiliamazoniense]|uniref:SH3 domain-containing protein n=1 Tax=Clostridium massiliamazoniense TaxID=1347366 RepID=UPI0006D78059|nr:SH3 domain-containing protein [Clostridium massiliamazoniense]